MPLKKRQIIFDYILGIFGKSFCNYYVTGIILILFFKYARTLCCTRKTWLHAMYSTYNTKRSFVISSTPAIANNYYSTFVVLTGHAQW